MEDVNKQQLNFLSLSEVEYGSEEFGTKRIRLHLKKLQEKIIRNFKFDKST